MADENADANLQEVVTPEQESQPETVAVDTPPVPQEDAQERNWREMRQAFKELKRENQFLREQFERAQQPAKEEEDTDENEPYVTPKSFKKKIHELEQRLVAKEAESIPDRLRAKYADFDEVVSVENVEFLKQNDPELAISLASLASDPYKQGIAAYKLLKRSDYNSNKVSMQEKAKIAENAKKPTSVQAVRKQGALSDANKFANGLTPELKKTLYAEMQAARKGA
jgi:hypothetical protein